MLMPLFLILSLAMPRGLESPLNAIVLLTCYPLAENRLMWVTFWIAPLFPGVV